MIQNIYRSLKYLRFTQKSTASQLKPTLHCLTWWWWHKTTKNYNKIQDRTKQDVRQQLA